MSDYVDATAMGPADEQKSRPPSSGPRAAPAAPLPTATAMAPPAATARLGLGSDPGPFQGADSSPALNRAPPGLSDPPGGSAPPPPPLRLSAPSVALAGSRPGFLPPPWATLLAGVEVRCRRSASSKLPKDGAEGGTSKPLLSLRPAAGPCCPGTLKTPRSRLTLPGMRASANDQTVMRPLVLS